jgi:hypothetical protein
MEVVADLPYRGRIASLFDKRSYEVEDLLLPGRQFHESSIQFRATNQIGSQYWKSDMAFVYQKL